MIGANTVNIGVMLSADVPHIQTEITEGLLAEGYKVLEYQPSDHLESLISASHIDAVIFSTPIDDWQTFESLKSITERPLLCLITPYPDTPVPTDALDLILPWMSANTIIKNISKLLGYRQELIAAQQHQDEITLLKNAIVRNVSHELKTPLLQVKSAVALITEENVDEKLARMAVQATARLETVVKNITLLADSLNSTVEPFLIAESLDHAMRNLRRIWLHKDAMSRIQLHVEPNLPFALGDKQAIGIVLQQLLDNALKFSQAEVSVEIRRCEAGICVAVSDKGIGIAADKLQQIFESFYQVDSSSTRRYGGTGVGLAIVRLIMEKHNAEIHVESTVQQGSKFSFVLPSIRL